MADKRLVEFPVKLIGFLILAGSVLCTISAEDKLVTTKTPRLLVDYGSRAALSPDGRFVAAIDRNDPVVFVETLSATGAHQRRRLLLPDTGHDTSFYRPSFSPNGSQVAILCHYTSPDEKDHALLAVCDATSGRLVVKMELPESSPYMCPVRFSATGDAVFVGARNRVYRCDVNRGEVLPLGGDIYYVWDVADRPGLDQLAYVLRGHDLEVHLWSLSKKSELPTPLGKEIADRLTRICEDRFEKKNPRLMVVSCDFSSDGSELAVAVNPFTKGGNVFILRMDMKKNELISTVVLSERETTFVRYVGDTKTLIVGCGFWYNTNAGLYIIEEGDTECGKEDWLPLAIDPDSGSDPKSWAIDTELGGGFLVATNGGQIWRWERADLPETWKSLFKGDHKPTK